MKPEQKEMECDGAEIRATLWKQEIDAWREGHKTEADRRAPGTTDNDSGKSQNYSHTLLQCEWETVKEPKGQTTFRFLFLRYRSVAFMHCSQM